MGDPGHRKEEYLFKVARYARERGMSLLAVDLLGSGAGAEFDEVVGRPDLEFSVGCVMDYLTTRDDVDERRIAVLGDGAGSSFVARGVALDNRFAAVVCDGGTLGYARARLPDESPLAGWHRKRGDLNEAGPVGDSTARS